MAHIPVKKKCDKPQSNSNQRKADNFVWSKASTIFFQKNFYLEWSVRGGLLFCDPLPHHNGCTLEMCYREPARDEKKSKNKR